MQISQNVHQIRIDFEVTNKIRRYVYIYLIVGRSCYLIDSGVSGSEQKIADYMKTIGRDIREIKAIFLTHGHPDHIGGAAIIQRLSNCQIYASQAESVWIENIDIQFKQRPIPNFYNLLNESVHIDCFINDKDEFILEENLTLEILNTAGHSYDSMAFIYRQQNILFSGDAIPIFNDYPIFVDFKQSQLTLEKLKGLKDIQLCCPAWDRVYTYREFPKVVYNARHLLQKFYSYVHECPPNDNIQMIMTYVAKQMGWQQSIENPLFQTSIEACIQFNTDL